MKKETIMNYVKKHKVIILSTFVFAGVLGTLVTIQFKPKLELKLFDGTLIWDYNRNIGGNNYVLYRNDEKVIASKQIKYRDSEYGDKTPPNDIEKLDIVYKEEDIILSWKEPKDNGNTNNYYVTVEDEDGNILVKSNEVSMESISGVADYRINFNNKEQNVVGTEFKINSKDLKEGKYELVITARDRAGNEGNEYIKEIEIYRPYVKDNKIYINNDKKYTYKAFVNCEEISINGNEIDVQELKDIDAPNQIKKVSVWNRGDNASILWSSVKDSGSKYDVSIVGTSSGGDKVVGTGEVTVKSSGVKGYYYAIKDTMEYVLNSSDMFTSKTLILSVDLPYETNYLHIAAVDNNGNIGQAYVKVLDGNVNEAEVIDKVGDKIVVE